MTGLMPNFDVPQGQDNAGFTTDMNPEVADIYNSVSLLAKSDPFMDSPSNPDYIKESSEMKSEFSYQIGDKNVDEIHIVSGSALAFLEVSFSGKIALPATDMHPDSDRYVEMPVESSGLPSMDTVLRFAEDPEVSVISICHVNRTTGIIAPLNEYMSVISGTKTAFHVNITDSHGILDTSSIWCDSISLNSKGIFGPQSVGIAWMSSKCGVFGFNQIVGTSIPTMAMISGFSKAIELSWSRKKDVGSIMSNAKLVEATISSISGFEIVGYSLERSSRHICFSAPNDGSYKFLSNVKSEFGISFDYPVTEDSKKTLIAMGVQNYSLCSRIVIDYSKDFFFITKFISALSSSTPIHS